MGIFGLTVRRGRRRGPRRGGAVIAMEELSRADPGFTLSYLAHEILFVHNVYTRRAPTSAARYLPQVISGDWIAGMA